LRKRYRSRIGIILDILESIEELERLEGKALPTKIMYRANLSYKRLGQYLDELEGRGLVEKKGEGYAVTREGRRFIEELTKLKRFLSAFGFEI